MGQGSKRGITRSNSSVIKDFLKTCPTWTSTYWIACNTKVPPTKASKLLWSMEKSGKVKKYKSDGDNYWMHADNFDPREDLFHIQEN